MATTRQLLGDERKPLGGMTWSQPGFGQQFASDVNDYAFTGGAGIRGQSLHKGAPHQTSTLDQLQRLDIQRSEKILNVEVATKLAGYEDPIKLIFPPVIQTEAVVYVRRQYVVGGIATEVPERAPAPVSSVQEDVREVRLRRFGGDVDFNINACLKPDMFQKEMDMKVAAQHAALQYELNKMGYQCMLNEGTTLVSALIRSQYSAAANPRKAASLFYNQMVFGALQKFTYPLHNLLAAAKKCTAYDISTSAKTVMILPHGTPEMMSLTKAENMIYNVNGLTGPQGKAVSLELESGYQIPASTASVFVHIPPPSHVFGAAAPTARKSELMRTRKIGLLYNGTDSALDHKLGTLVSSSGNQFRMLEMNMMSGIIAVPGEETGNLIMQYPRSTVATDASTESGRMMLRVLMGVVCKRPENILVLEDISCAGVERCEAVTASLTGAASADGAGFAVRDGATDTLVPMVGNAYDVAKQGNEVYWCPNGTDSMRTAVRCYVGNHFDPAGNLKLHGNSPLGNLDDPANLHKLHGMQVFDPTMAHPSGGAATDRAASM